MVKPEVIGGIINKIKEELDERNYSGIYSIVDEAGSGKSQIAFFTQQELGHHNVKTGYFIITEQKDIDEFSDYFENLKGKNVIFIDEINALLGSISSENKKRNHK